MPVWNGRGQGDATPKQSWARIYPSNQVAMREPDVPHQ